jgi:hypothetical protein
MFVIIAKVESINVNNRVKSYLEFLNDCDA